MPGAYLRSAARKSWRCAERIAVADVPDCLVLKRHRDMAGRTRNHWFRRGLLAAACVLPILALVNLFGQRPATSVAATHAATLKVYAASRVRGGLLYQARFHVFAKREIKKAILVLDSNWLEGMTLNTLEPSPVSEASRNGDLSLELGHIPQGQSHLLFIQFQVDPTNVGHRSQDVSLYDGGTKLLSIHRTITIYP
jgi:hypothetical protein